MSNKVYDILKWLVILFLPALAKFIEPLFATWGIPYGPQIADTITYFQIFLGSIIGISSIMYAKGLKDKEKTEDIVMNLVDSMEDEDEE